MVYRLSNYEMDMISKGIQEEERKDIREYPAMPQETKELYYWFQKSGGTDYIRYNALKQKVKFWRVYFNLGLEAAMKQHELKQQLSRLETKAVRTECK